jgi:prepilin-type N-terminal cleavage/methylation domain-containing protein
MALALIITVICHNNHSHIPRAGFTFIEALIAISLIGIGVATSLTALLKINSIACMGRNATGAQTFAQNEIDKFLSYSPFNPPSQVPKDLNNSPPDYDLNVGTHTYNNVPIYNDPDNGVVVTGTITTVISDVSQTYINNGNSVTIPMYQTVVTVSYTYLNRNYTSTASTVRVSDI